MPNEKTSDESTGGTLKNADLLRYSEEIGGTFTPNSSKKHTLQTFKNYFNAGLVVVGNEFLSPESVAASADPAYSLGSGSGQTFTSYSKSLGEAQADFPNADIDSVDDFVDTAAINQASYLMVNGGRQNRLDFGLYGSREYIIDKKIGNIPKASGKANIEYLYEGNGSVITQTSPTEDVFSTLPADQTEAGNVTTLTNLVFRNFAIRNQGTTKGSGQAGFRIGGRGLTIEECYATGFDVNYDILFCLHSYFKRAFSFDHMTSGHVFRTGTGAWTGASLSNSACNDVDVIDCLSKTARGSDYGFAILGSSDVNLYGCTTEGNVDDTDLPGQPLAGVFIDTQNSSVVKGTCQVHGLHGEQSYVDGLIHVKSREGIYQFSDISNQFQGLYAGGNKNLIKLESYGGFTYFRLDNFAHWLPDLQFDLGDSSCLPIFGYPWSATAAILDNAAFWATFQPTLSDLQKSVYPP